jgi:outer membrane receptor for ferrienterochelin and colicin
MQGKRLLTRILPGLLILLWASVAMAGVTGKIAGRVTDATTGEPLYGANVILLDRIENGERVPIPGNRIQGAATDQNGEYFIINIKPGIYSVQFTYMGYRQTVKTQIRVMVDRTTRVDCPMSPTVVDAGETVVVTAERVEIQKDLTSSEVSIGAEKIDVMPVRSVNALLDLQAGVVRDAGGSLHIRGGRSSEITYMVDGVQVIDPINRSAGVSIDDQAIEELKTITGTFNAEYGQALSGVVNIVTKQGSNKFQMNLTSYFGDYFSLDDDVYYIMDNAEWANAAARALTQKSRWVNYDFSRYSGSFSEIFREKPYLTRKSYLGGFNPAKSQDIQLNMSGPVPFTGKKVTFFASGRYQYQPGFVYGARYFMPWGFQAPVSDTLHTFDMPDNEIVPLSKDRNYSTQSKIYFNLTPSISLSYGLYYNHNNSYSTGWNYKYVPDAGKHYITSSQTHIATAKYVFSPSTFAEFRGSHYIKHHKNYLYEDPYDYRYMPVETGDIEQYVYGKSQDDDISVTSRVNDFNFYGNPVDHGKEDVKYTALKFDLTSQITKHHLIKTGFSARFHDLRNDWFLMQFSDENYRPIVPDESSPFHVNYKAKPRELAAYIQDKIEFKELIINVGVRFDYFDPDAPVLADPADPQIYDPFLLDNIYSNYSPTTPDSELVEYTIEERKAFWYKDAEPNYQISPRVGISFPITEQGVIRFSYGHFFQNPQLRFLYDNPNFWIEGAGARNLVGNAGLKPERTVQYEIGLQQQLMEDLYMYVTGFYRDIRDWIGTGAPIDTYSGIAYYQYENKDHAAAKGITLTARYRRNNFDINLDYTYMTAQGTSSDPQDAYNGALANEAPRLQLLDLNWDQRQSLNTVFGYSYKGWNGSLIATVNSGLPYTPTFARGEVSGSGTFVGLRENSERRPWSYNVDFRLSRTFKLWNYQLQLFVNVQNLLDTRNANSVYSDTGRPDFTLQGINQVDRPGDPDVEISNVDEYFTRPWNFTPPRFIQVGFRLSI